MWIEYGLESHFERLRAKGMLTLDEMAQRLDISTQQLKTWRAVGFVRAHLCNDNNEYLYEDPGADPSIHHGKPVARLGNRLKISLVSWLVVTLLRHVELILSKSSLLT